MKLEKQNGEPTANESRFVSYDELLRLAWRRKSLLALGLVIGIILGALYYVQKTPVYEASARVLVIEKRPEVVTGQQIVKSQIEDYASTHRILITSPIIVQRAIDQFDLGSLECLQDSENLQSDIVDHLTVSRVTRDADSVLQLSFKSTLSNECGVVVNAILTSYQKFLEESYDDMSEDTVGLITEARDILETDLRAKEKQYLSFRENAPLIWNGEDEVNPGKDRLAAIELERSNLLLRKAELQGKLETITKAMKSGKSQRQLVALVSDLSEDTTDSEGNIRNESSLRSELLPLLLEEKRLMEDFGASHPYVLAVRERIKATRNFFALPSAAYVAPSDANPESAVPTTESDDVVKLYVEYLGNEIERMDTSEGVLSDLYEAELQDARQLNSFALRDEEFRTDISRSQALYDGLIERLQEASLIKDYGGFKAQIIAPAGKGKKVAPRISLVGAGSIFFGLLIGGLMAFIAEKRDTSFKAPEEIRQRLGLSIVGHIPKYAGEAAGENGSIRRDGMLCSHFKPRSAESESFRSIRTALYFSSGGEDHKVLQVTSPNPGDGKSTVTANLAVCIAKSQKSVLMVDADLRKPQLHKIFGVESELGLAAAIGFDVEPFDTIIDTEIENLSLMPAGIIPPDPAELLTSQRFPELLETLRQKYDYVIVDSAPLLAVTDPSIVAACVDGVLLTIRISKDGRVHAERAKDILDSMNANIVGVVVNAVERNGDTSYGNFGYGYGMGYGYGQPGYYGAAEENGATEENGRATEDSRTVSTT